MAVMPHATAQSQTLCPGQNYQFFESDRLVIVEAESQPATGDWVEDTTIGGFTGSSYYRWSGEDFFRDPGNGLLEYKIRINNPGRYRFYMRSRNPTMNGSEHNDMWVRFPEADEFYGFRASDNSIVYPHGNTRGPNGSEQTPTTEGGDNNGGWMKAFQNNPDRWWWYARTSDNDSHDIYVEFDSVGTYTMQISGRSSLFIIDRFALFDEALYSDDSIEGTARPETGCDGNTLFSVISTTPRAGENNVAPGRDVEISFSKPVIITNNNWFLITCPPTPEFVNSNNSVITSDRTDFVINPDSNFPNGYTCTMRIFASAVRDINNNPMSNGDYEFSFTMRNNARPILLESDPTDGDTFVAPSANIQLTFTEPVTEDTSQNNWFRIECSPSGLSIRPNDTFVTGTGTTRTINPNADLLEGDTCTLTLPRGRVTDNEGASLYQEYEFTFTVGSLAPIDVNEDGIITAEDAVFVVNRIGTSVDNNSNAPADVNKDGQINQFDVNIVISVIGESVP